MPPTKRLVSWEPQARLEHFTEGARDRILDAVAALLVPVSAPAARVAA